MSVIYALLAEETVLLGAEGSNKILDLTTKDNDLQSLLSLYHADLLPNGQPDYLNLRTILDWPKPVRLFVIDEGLTTLETTVSLLESKVSEGISVLMSYQGATVSVPFHQVASYASLGWESTGSECTFEAAKHLLQRGCDGDHQAFNAICSMTVQQVLELEWFCSTCGHDFWKGLALFNMENNQ